MTEREFLIAYSAGWSWDKLAEHVYPRDGHDVIETVVSWTVGDCLVVVRLCGWPARQTLDAAWHVRMPPSRSLPPASWKRKAQTDRKGAHVLHFTAPWEVFSDSPISVELHETDFANRNRRLRFYGKIPSSSLVKPDQTHLIQPQVTFAVRRIASELSLDHGTLLEHFSAQSGAR